MAHVSILCSTWGRAVLFGGCVERILWAIVLLGEIRNPKNLNANSLPWAYENKNQQPNHHGKDIETRKTIPNQHPTAQPWAHECWTAGAAQMGIILNPMTHSAAMGYYV